VKNLPGQIDSLSLNRGS